MIEPLFLLDANICVYILEASVALLRERIEERAEDEIVISSVAAAEVLFGARRRGNERQALSLFQRFTVIPFDAAAAIAYMDLPFRRGGFDRLIAAHALSLGLTLVTNNERDFADVPGLSIENWTR